MNCELGYDPRTETERAYDELGLACRELKLAYMAALAPVMVPILDWLVRVLPKKGSDHDRQ